MNSILLIIGIILILPLILALFLSGIIGVLTLMEMLEKILKGDSNG